MDYKPEVWDWVIHLKTGMIGRVSAIGKRRSIYVCSWHWTQPAPIDEIRAATQEEIRRHLAHISSRLTESEQPFAMGDAVDTSNGPGLYWRSDSDGRHRVWHGSECRVYELNELMATNVHEATG